MTRVKNGGKIEFQLGWGGLIALTMSIVCVLLWIFVLGFWVGQKLVGRSLKERPGSSMASRPGPKPEMVSTPASEVPKAPGPSELPTEHITGKNLTGPVPSQSDKKGRQEAKIVSVTTEKGYNNEMDQTGHPVTRSPVQQIQKTQKKSIYFVLQIASYREKEWADREVRRWKDKGYHSQMRKIDLGPDKGIWYRVYLEEFRSIQEATAFANDMSQKEGLKSYIVPLRD